MNAIEACEVCGRKYNKAKMNCPGCAAQAVVDAERKAMPADNFPYVSRVASPAAGTSAPDLSTRSKPEAGAQTSVTQTLETSDALLLNEVKKLQKTQSRIEDTISNIAKGLGLIFSSAFLSGIALFLLGLSDGSSSTSSAVWAGVLFALVSLFFFIVGTRTLLNA
jgi:hypothetical protein